MIKIQIEYDNIDKSFIDEEWIYFICKTICNNKGHNSAQINIIFSNDSKLNKLKKEYFGEDLLTDTISFNLESEGEPIDGEIYISLDRVNENAKSFSQDFIQEYKRVVIHSCLHLLGYEDTDYDDKQTMTDLEEKYLSLIMSVN